MKPEHLEVKNFNFIGLNSETTGEVTYFGEGDLDVSGAEAILDAL